MILNTDGGARGNPGPGAAAAVLTDSGIVVSETAKYLGTCTNNEAEYQAIILGLHMVSKMNVNEITCHLDSELVVKQLRGEYKVKNARLSEFFKEVKKLEKNFKSIKYVHVPRAQNEEADALVNKTLDSVSL
ncbi:MAG TPA: ribonuclease HI family protein [Candidatus Saccharimonadales bacterium]|nr:ribonuclease HI family protein [Candidatus Saccharimonadales bacterium]